MSIADSVLGTMTDDVLIKGFRKVATPMLVELQRRGFRASISNQGTPGQPEIVLTRGADRTSGET